MIHSRREFLGLLVGTAACAATPAIFATATDDKLDQICWRIGQCIRDRNIKPSRVIAIDEVGRLVLVGWASLALCADTKNRMFHIADRDLLNYTRLHYRVEPRYLERANELSVFVNGCDTFSLVFT
jgi:hypothetical protein